MKKVNNSQPLSVATQFRPLSTSVHIDVLGGLSASQFYKQTSLQWLPDHTLTPTFDASGSQTDGTLRLAANYSIIDPDGLLDTDSLVPQVFWYVDGTQITAIDQSADYYVSNNILYVRKNFTHTQGATVMCECRFTDMRTASPFVLSDSITLSAILQADELWAVSILNDKTRKHYPLSATSSIYDFEAEARLGSDVRNDNVGWFWDYSLDNGATWLEIDDDCYWHVSGKNTNTLRVDMDYVEQITVRARISEDKSASAPDLPNSATASCAWRTPLLYPTVFSYGGDRVFKETAFMTFGVHVHLPSHDDLSADEVRHWLMFNWGIREQGSTSGITALGGYEPECVVPASKLFNTDNKKYIIDPQISLRGIYDVLADSSGELFQVGDDLLAVRT